MADRSAPDVVAASSPDPSSPDPSSPDPNSKVGLRRSMRSMRPLTAKPAWSPVTYGANAVVGVALSLPGAVK